MLTPDILFDSYRDITPPFCKVRGVTLLLTDLDYTLAPKVVRRPDDALRQWIDGTEGRRDHRDDRVEQPLRCSRD